MLSRTAQNLFWLARYMERAEATARLIEMGQRMALLPGPKERNEWRSVMLAAGAPVGADEKITESKVIKTLLLSADNPGSVRYCLDRARANAKAVRTALTQQQWETLNDGWRRFEALAPEDARQNLGDHVDWVKQRAATFRGATEGFMLRNDRYDFLLLGGYLERANMTLRLLDIKYYVLLPESEVVGGHRDHYQWRSILLALSGHRAFHHSYDGDYSPWKISDFLILSRAFPRSVAFCYGGIRLHLQRLGQVYGEEADCSQTADDMIRRLSAKDVGEIFQTGLHEFVVSAINTTYRLSQEISDAYHF